METAAVVSGRTPATRGSQLVGARILVVEDEFLIALQLQSIFEAEGAEVLGPYHTLADAMKHVEIADITAASLDLNLGKETAIPVAGLLQKRGVPFLFYSVQTGDPALAQWHHVPLIQKPAAPEQLVEAMAALVQIREPA